MLETIILGAGVVISLILGVINLSARREKVAVVNPIVYAEFIPKGSWVDGPDGSRICLHNHAELSFEASCELVLTQGEKELEVRDVGIILDSKTCEKLKRYFYLPRHNRLTLYHSNAYNGDAIPQPMILETKKTLCFKRVLPITCADEFGEEYKKMEDGYRPEYIQPLLDELEAKYMICWTRYDGKTFCWRFPDKWWRNLGKKL